MSTPAPRGRKAERYRKHLRRLAQWDAFLLAESGLPGPRANLELAPAVADLGDRPLFRRYLSFGPARAPTNSPQEFLVLCGVIGYGRLLAQGHASALPVLRRCAGDPRWRVRESVALALQRLGERDMHGLLRCMRGWNRGTLLERRATAAALCEPRLLRTAQVAKSVLDILRQITGAVTAVTDRKQADFHVLRKTLGYAWSVAAAALPGEGRRQMERWVRHPDTDVSWIMKENLTKKRLTLLAHAWVARCRKMLDASDGRTARR